MPIVLIIMSVLIGHLVFKYVRRRRFLVHLRKARIMPTELKRRLDAGDDRTALDIEPAPYRIPQARWIAPEALRSPHQLISRDSEIVFYCAEPRRGDERADRLPPDDPRLKNVHPLSGGRGLAEADSSSNPSEPAWEPATARS